MWRLGNVISTLSWATFDEIVRIPFDVETMREIVDKMTSRLGVIAFDFIPLNLEGFQAQLYFRIIANNGHLLNT